MSTNTLNLGLRISHTSWETNSQVKSTLLPLVTTIRIAHGLLEEMWVGHCTSCTFTQARLCRYYDCRTNATTLSRLAATYLQKTWRQCFRQTFQWPTVTQRTGDVCTRVVVLLVEPVVDFLSKNMLIACHKARREVSLSQLKTCHSRGLQNRSRTRAS